MSTQDLYLSEFDETMLDLTFQHGKSQLQQIRVSQKWKNPRIKNKLPALECHWYNKTEKTVDQISQFSQEYYQPSLVDVGTSIFIQVMPQTTPDLQYIGMPFSKSVGPILLSKQTEEQVIELMEAGKSTFFIEIKDICLKRLTEQEQEPVEGFVPIAQCLLKVVKNQLILLGRTLSMSKAETLLQVRIDKDYPQLIIDRKAPRFLNILFNSEEYATLVLQNHRIRDVLCLLTKMIAEKQIEVQIAKPNTKLQVPSSPCKTQEKEARQNQELMKEQKEPQLTATTLEQILPLSISKQQNEKNVRQQSMNLFQKTPIKQPLPQQRKETKDASNILIISQLRDKLSKLEADFLKHQKENENTKSKYESSLQESKKLSEQLSKSQEELSRIKQKIQQQEETKKKNNEKMCYLDNQCRILQQELADTNYKCKALTNKLQEMQRKIQKQLPSEKTKHQHQQFDDLNYDQLLCLLITKQEAIHQIQFKGKYHLDKIDQLESELKEAKINLESVQSHNKQLLKKIESILQSKQLVKIQPNSLQQNRIHSLQFEISKLKEELNIQQQTSSTLTRDNQSLKSQVKDLIEENHCFRSKQKSSKHELKLQIAELKKLVNRFTEMITDKDVQMDNLKMINKEISKSLAQLQTK